MIIYIAICDDDKSIGFIIEEILMQISKETYINFITDVYFSGKNLYKSLSQGQCYDLIFLDTDIKDINGLEVGKLIRNQLEDRTTNIVYISRHPQYALKSFDNNPLNYLLKPLNYNKINKVILQLMSIYKIRCNIFTYTKNRHDIYRVKCDEIMFLESSKKKIIIHMANNKRDDFYGSLKRVFKEQLQTKDFLLVHNSYIVNYDYIMISKSLELVLTNGIMIPISQKKAKNIREEIIKIEKRRTIFNVTE